MMKMFFFCKFLKFGNVIINLEDQNGLKCITQANKIFKNQISYLRLLDGIFLLWVEYRVESLLKLSDENASLYKDRPYP